MSAIPQDLYHSSDPGVDQGKTLSDYLGVLRRRKGLMLTVAVVLFAIVAAIAMTMAAVYRSTSTILIQEQEIPQELVRSTVTSFADERIQVISQQVMTRSVLLDLVDKYGLYGKLRQRDTSEEILDRMRRDIKLTPISADVTDRRTGSQIKSTIAFTLAYESESAGSAQKIANELTTLFLNENVKNRQQKAAETSSFLQEELTRLTAHISEVEQKLSDFKRRNQGRLPELAVVNMQSSDRTEAEMLHMDREIQSLEERKILLQGQLAQIKPANPILANNGTGVVLEPEDRLKAVQAQLSSLVGVYSEDHPDVKRARREIASLKAETGSDGNDTDVESRRTELQAQLGVLREKYAEEHPDVQKTQRALAALDKPVDAAETKSARRERKPDNPMYITLQSQIASTLSEIEASKRMRVDLRAKMGDLERRMMQAPEVEREYLELARDQESSRGRFRELREKQMQAEVAEQLERGRKAERFTLIDPAIYPEKPVRPNRVAILAFGFVLAVAGGIGAAALRESFNRTVNNPKDVVRVLRVPMLAVIPTPTSAGALQRRRVRRWLLLLGGVVAVFVALAAVHFFFMPLEVLWYSLLRRLGI